MAPTAAGTGHPPAAPARLVASGLTAELANAALGSASNTPALSRPQRALSRAVQPFARVILRRVFRHGRA
jgi:hypothetical protein